MLRRTRPYLPPLLALTALMPRPLDAQVTEPELGEADRIRVFTAGIRTPLVGAFRGYDGPVLLVGTGQDEVTRVYLDRVDRLERRVAEESPGFWTGAMIGAGGALLGGAILQAVGGSEAGPNMAMAGGALLALPVGLVAGLVTSTISRESWEEVTIRLDGGGP